MDRRAIALMNTDLFDPNAALREVNRKTDHVIELFQINGYLQRQMGLIQYAGALQAVKQEAENLFNERSGVSDEMHRLIRESNETTAMATALFLCPNTLVTYAQLDQLQAHYDMSLALAPVALAIGGYHAEHGEYPPDLQALVPAYLDSLPTDFATGKLPVYRTEDGAAIVYSLGTDLEDDGGLDDVREGDVVFRIER